MTMNLYQASRQWATRPDDERFWDIEEMLAATRRYKESAREAVVETNSLSLRPVGDDGADLEIVGKAGIPAKLTHWAFGQVSRIAGAPADYLRSLPSALVAQNLNHGLRTADGESNLLLHKNGSTVLRSVSSDKYGRIWDCDVLSRLANLQEFGWRVPPARPAREGQKGTRKATEKDVLEIKGSHGLSVKVGDLIAPAGLYASDHDCFAFMVNEKYRIKDGTDMGLSRGFFLWNSEVANGRKCKVTTFLYRSVCGNHIVWDASEVKEIGIVHRGDAWGRFESELTVFVKDYITASAAKDEDRITQAQKFILPGKSRDDVIDGLFKALRGTLTRKALEAGYLRAEKDSATDRTINPRSAYGLVQGLTAYSQTVPYMDERAKIDNGASKILSMAF